MTTRLSRSVRHFAIGALALAALAAVSIQPPAQAQAAVDIRAEYVVTFKPGQNAAGNAATLARGHGASHVYSAVFDGFCAPLSDSAVDALRKNPNVDTIEPVFEVKISAESTPAGISRISATSAHSQGATGAGANVAIIDTGIQLNHPDLAANVNTALSRTFVSKGSTTVGGNDDNGHGTHVAGTVAATRGNNIGVVGVAPQATLIALKVLNRQGSGSSGDIIAALDYITAHNNAQPGYATAIHVANCSFGGSGSDSDTSYRRAFERCVASGCFVAVAAGNSNRDSAGYVPAAYDAVFTVSAMNPTTNAFASFSNWGHDVDMAAPGVSTHSTYLNSGYASLSGTSMACPHVAGAAALYVAQNKASMLSATAGSQVRQALLSAGEAIVMTGDPDSYREPLVNAGAVVGPVAPPTPAVTIAVSPDKSPYAETDTVAVLTVTVRDELAAGITGLAQGAFTVTGATATGFNEVGGGDYQIEVDIAGFSLDIDYPVNVEVTDTRNLSDDQTVLLRRASTPPPPPPGTIFVSSIGYRQTGPHLFIDVTIGATTGGVDLSGISVGITLYRNSTSMGSASGSTNSSGVVSFRLQSAPSGTYSTTVNSVSKAGLTYDSGLNAADPGYSK